MNDLLIFLIFLLAGIFFSELFKTLHLPYVLALIVAGIVIGPIGLDLVELTPPIVLLGSIGAIFVMFMAGLDIKIDYLVKMWKKVALCALINGGIPSFVGFLIVYIFGYDLVTSFLIGVIFISSSVAVILPTLQQKKLIFTNFGSILVGSVVIEDVISLLLISLILQISDPTSTLPLPVFMIVVVISVFLIRKYLPKIEKTFFSRARKGVEENVQFVFISLIAIAVFFELLGMHAIVAGFLVGVVLSKTIKEKPIEDKLHVLSYGVFIPIFFLKVGIETNLTVFFQANGVILLALTIVTGLILSKILSGYLCGKIMGFTQKERLLFGVSSIPQLSTSLAVTFTALERNLIDANLQVSIVFLSVTTILIAPLVVGFLTKNQNNPWANTAKELEH
ncbi:MAG: cation:proton antiporter [Candidatus Bathyarchaeota archaeon]|nr:cation:proton antiporter [Candidatus Bathyarchaeum tardum]WNZ29655.1 MAG: cation:proton antiporter [Candidatus Bathyarchaeota archaeon]